MNLSQACRCLLSYLSGKPTTNGVTGPDGSRAELTPGLLDEAREIVLRHARPSTATTWGTETDRLGNVRQLDAKEGLFNCLESLSVFAQNVTNAGLARYPWPLITEALKAHQWDKIGVRRAQS